MILGYLDKEDRAYDLNFATLRMKIRVEADPARGSQVLFTPTGGAATGYKVLGDAEAALSVAMDHGGDRVPLLQRVDGHLYRHERGLLFIAAPAKRDPEDPTFFLVKLRALPSAVKFFFEDQEGREFVSIPNDEVLSAERGSGTAVVLVNAANVALPKEKLAYAVEVGPLARVARLLEGLPGA